MQHYRNARTAIAQIRAGEWVVVWSCFLCTYASAERNGLRLWIGGGGFFCDVSDDFGNRYFGLFWRHLVWWAAARELKQLADKSKRAHVPVLK